MNNYNQKWVLLAILSSCTGSNNNYKKNFLTENDIKETLSKNELKLNYLINDKNKEYFISSLLESDYKFNIVFDDDGKKLRDRLTESNLSFFCNSFLSPNGTKKIVLEFFFAKNFKDSTSRWS